MSNNNDGWSLILNKVKIESTALYVLMLKTIPFKIEEGTLFVSFEKQFYASILKEEENFSLVQKAVKEAVHLDIELVVSQETHKRISLPIKERENSFQESEEPKKNAVVDFTEWTLKKIIYKKEGFYILSFKKNKEEITVKCNTDNSLIEGGKYNFSGEWVKVPKYGMQVNAFFIEPAMYGDALVFLSSGVIKGVKEGIAKRIVEQFGDKTFEIFDTDINRLLEVSGIGPKTLEKIKKSYGEKQVMKETISFFRKFDIPVSQIFKMYKQYGNEAIQTVKENPYRLINDIEGIGFKKADNIGRKLGIEENDPFRIKSGITYALQQAASVGNTYLPVSILIDSASEILDLPKDAVNSQIKDTDIIVDDGRAYLKYLYRYEHGVKDDLIRISSINSPLNYRYVSSINLSLAQRKAVDNVFKFPISIISGSPGTGKSTCIDTIVKSAKASHYSIALASPTGKASMRMKEITGHEASTIHKLLKIGMDNKKGIDTLDYDIVVIDETSMLDISLAYMLLSSVKSGSHVVFVGDADQLPSVGPGNFLNDIIYSKLFPTVFLNTIYRQGEGSIIAFNAKKIKDGKFIESGTDFIHFDLEDPDDIVGVIKSIAQKYPEVQVLTPTRKGALSVSILNRELQQIVNPGEKKEISFFIKTFKEGDRVMQLKNDYEKGVFNGETGVIRSIDEEDETVEIDFIDKIVTYEKYELDDISVAYASTVHKFQGSETDVVAVVLHPSQYILLQRKLLYTAITRAKKQVFLIGARKAIWTAIKNTSSSKRYSNLLNLLSANCKVSV